MNVPRLLPHTLAPVFVLLCVSALTHCFSVTTGGNRATQMFFCKIPGCAVNVTHVFCDNKLLLGNTPIPYCTGPPPPSTVCQNDSRAFVTIDTDGSCEFEGNAYIKTIKCTDQSKECVFSAVATSKPPPTVGGGQDKDRTNTGLIVISVVGLCLFTILGLSLYICAKKRNSRKQKQPASILVLTEPLRGTQSSGETSEQDTHGGAPGLDDGISHSQPDHGT